MLLPQSFDSEFSADLTTQSCHLLGCHFCSISVMLGMTVTCHGLLKGTSPLKTSLIQEVEEIKRKITMKDLV